MSLHRSPPQPVEDFTNAFLVSFGFLVFAALFAIWSLWGLLVALLVSWAMDRGIVAGVALAARRRAVVRRQGPGY